MQGRNQGNPRNPRVVHQGQNWRSSHGTYNPLEPNGSGNHFNTRPRRQIASTSSNQSFGGQLNRASNFEGNYEYTYNLGHNGSENNFDTRIGVQTINRSSDQSGRGHTNRASNFEGNYEYTYNLGHNGSENNFNTRIGVQTINRSSGQSGRAHTNRGSNFGGRNGRNSHNRRGFHERQNQNTDHSNTPSFRQDRERRPLGFRALENLLEKDPDQLLLELSNSKKGILELIQEGLKEDTIILLVKILKKVADTPFDEVKYKVLQTYFDDTFRQQLINYILYLPMHDQARQNRNKYFWKDPDDFWNNLIAVCEEICNSIPTFCRKALPDLLKSLIVCFPSFERMHSRHISDQITENVTKLNEVVQTIVTEYEESHKTHLEQKMNQDIDEEPPDDFRQISVYPKSLELTAGAPVFLRKNVVDRPYRDVNHYLDVQFRLLREDFVGPLRTGIGIYRSGVKKRLENVRVYERVRFLNPETVNEQYCMRICFDSSKKKKSFKYENSKRFMFGALLCFSADQFRTIMFGKVADRKIEDLEKGELTVGFDRNVTVQYNVNYLMVECGVYFEPYFHVLNVLQSMSVDNFPMEKYIIRVDPQAQPPEYLASSNPVYTIRGHRFSPLVQWPQSNVYHLNDSQLAAFKAAITQEFSIIQGPPGTGKTFLGLKIAQTLIENLEAWYKKTPMLVICYTNHALDQFLEGISQFTQKILRVGGQSKNENLKQFNLRNKGRFKMSPAVYQQKSEVQIVLAQIKDVTENLKQIESYNSVREFNVFEEVVPDFKKTWFGRALKSDILDWLLSHKSHPTIPNMNEDEARISEAIGTLQIEDNPGSAEDSEDSDSEDEQNDDTEIQVDDIFEEVKLMAVKTSFPLITTVSLEQQIQNLQYKVNELKEIETSTLQLAEAEEKLTLELINVTARYNFLKAKLLEGKKRSSTKRGIPARTDLNNPHNMSPDNRWDLYFYWLDLYKQKLKEKSDLLSKQFREAFKIYEEMRDIENSNAMKDVLVVGMTTTGAARLRTTLQALRSPIVIVEEAAEVLEAHIVSALTPHCKHLILIGDHQQLKPSTASYSIERFYKLGISLFERMVINRIQLYTLNVQHRMKPQISSLITPTIYPKLEDHPSVNDRPPIKGLDNCLFFINHTHKEEDCEGTSKKNYHEVNFLINFAKHLILNGYKPENITILAAYLGQMFEMQKEKRKHKHVLGEVRIAVLDNYQGEECDIILLSLVRSNATNKIGFLSIENRVCVALSRARNGLYVMGNMAQLCAASELWPKIRRSFEQQNAIGSELALRCQVHRDRITYVKNGDDFLEIPEGGCNQKCGFDLSCGHKCTSLCHVQDRDHKGYRCREMCNKPLCDTNPNHLCQKMCYQECGPCVYLVARFLKCEHVVNLACHIDPDTHKCVERVPTQLPCGHTADKPCHYDPQSYRCPHPCEVKVEPCGHACELKCHVRQDPDHLQYKCKKKCVRYRVGCTVRAENHMCPNFCHEDCEPCTILVQKKRTVCPHVYKVACSSNVDKMICEKPCTKSLPCSHKCKNKCHEPCGNCQQKVDKVNPICGHTISVKCCEEPDRKFCNKKCPLQLPCGHPCTKKCNEPCTTDCKEIVDCSIAAPCGHTITRVKCQVANSASLRRDPKTLLKCCNQPCTTKLKCDHKCSGTCGECHQGRIHKRCDKKCGFPLVCNHPCEFPCRQACRPCARPCPYRCKHTSCSKRCGDVCTPCIEEKCSRRCRHQQCTKLCGEICNVPPCEAACDKPLKCGHLCIGLCGDPCPPKCLICDKKELTTIFFGSEDEENARFVLLSDCGHIFESTGLEAWLDQDGDKIGFKECPQCKTSITTTQRYDDRIKIVMADVAKVKQEFYGNPKENDTKRRELIEKLALLEAKRCNGILNVYCGSLYDALEIVKKRLQIERKGKRQQINKPELNAIESKLQIIEHVINICTLRSSDALHEVYVPQINFLMKLLIRDEDYMTDHEIEDIQCELNRLLRTVDFSKIKKTPYFDSYFKSYTQVRQTVEQIENILFSTAKFRNRDEEIVTQYLKNLSKLVASGIGISEQERRDIVKAMGFKQGHWFKCPNGHPYAIGECGGAMEEAKCPECGTKIGGTNHALVDGNTVATEMDGSRFGAWSNTANMADYQFD